MTEQDASQAVAAVALITVGTTKPRVLLLRRADNPQDPWSGHWALPGGRCEADETPLQACVRECAEECGLCLDPQAMQMALPIALAGTAMGRGIAVAPFHWHFNQAPALNELRLDAREIQEASFLPIAVMREWRQHPTASLAAAYPERLYPYYEHGGTPLWGFTYQVIKAWSKTHLSSQ